jgi:hypothetical protein
LRGKERELTHLKTERKSRQAELVRDGTSGGRRAELLVQVLELSTDQSTVEGEIAKLESELEQKRQWLAHLRTTKAR